MSKSDFSLFFDKIKHEQERVKKLKVSDIAAYAVERHTRRKTKTRKYTNKARAYLSIAGGDPCAYCGKNVAVNEMTIDHIVPKAHGGTNDWENLAPSCNDCNLRKDSVSLLLFLAEEHRHGRR